SAAAQTASFLRWRMVFFRAATGPALLPAVGLFVYGRPGAPFGLLLRNAAVLIAFLDVFGLAFLLVGVTRFVAAGHRGPPSIGNIRSRPATPFGSNLGADPRDLRGSLVPRCRARSAGSRWARCVRGPRTGTRNGTANG